jgi:hypothetical protein
LEVDRNEYDSFFWRLSFFVPKKSGAVFFMSDLSDYELQRLANIAANEAVLASLGLDKPLIDKPGSPKVKKAKVALGSPHLRERSARLQNKPVDYVGLTHEDDLWMEKKIRRCTNGGRKSKPVLTYADIQAREIEKPKKKRPRATVHSEYPGRFGSCSSNAFCAPSDSFSAMPMTPQRNKHTYHTNGRRVLCPCCNQTWVQKKDGTIRAHLCIPFNPVGGDAVLPSGF